MSLHAKAQRAVPAQTARIARAAFPKGNVYMKMRDSFGELFSDEQFRELYQPQVGKFAYSPSQLALISVLQFAEGLSDRQGTIYSKAKLFTKLTYTVQFLPIRVGKLAILMA